MVSRHQLWACDPACKGLEVVSRHQLWSCLTWDGVLWSRVCCSSDEVPLPREELPLLVSIRRALPLTEPGADLMAVPEECAPAVASSGASPMPCASESR